MSAERLSDAEAIQHDGHQRDPEQPERHDRCEGGGTDPADAGAR